MTEKTEYRKIDWPVFTACFISAPVLLAAVTTGPLVLWGWAFGDLSGAHPLMWLVVPFWAIIFGGPAYVILGLPALIWYLRRHPPKVLPIVVLAFLSMAGVPVLAVFGHLIVPDPDWFDILPAYLQVGAFFAMIWAAIFAKLYIRFNRQGG